VDKVILRSHKICCMMSIMLSVPTRRREKAKHSPSVAVFSIPVSELRMQVLQFMISAFQMSIPFLKLLYSDTCSPGSILKF